MNTQPILMYKKGYKKIVQEDYAIDITVPFSEHKMWHDRWYRDRIFNFGWGTRWVRMECTPKDRWHLVVQHGFGWDGASFIIDTRANEEAAFVHDALYHLLRNNKLHPSFKADADLLFRDTWIQNGGFRPWAKFCFRRLQKIDFAANPKNKKRTHKIKDGKKCVT